MNCIEKVKGLISNGEIKEASTNDASNHKINKYA